MNLERQSTLFMNKIHNNWSFFHRIYCISLEGRQDRRERAHREFVRLGIHDRVSYMVAERHATNSEQGIYESHLRCINDGLAAGAENMVIFEDDVVFDRFDEQRFHQSLAFLRQHPEWALFFLGCLVNGSRPTESRAVRAVDYRSLAHAYAINRPCALQVVEKSWQNTPYDVMLSRLNSNCYAICPMVAFQSDAATDNENRQSLDRIRRCFGGLRRIQRVNDWYHRNKALVVALHLIGFGLAFVLWMLLRRQF